MILFAVITSEGAMKQWEGAFTAPVLGRIPRHQDYTTAGGKEVHITLSHEVGGLGLLEREDAAILNAALSPLASRAILAFQCALHDAGIAAPLQLTANSGTLISAEVAQKVHLNLSGSC